MGLGPSASTPEVGSEAVDGAVDEVIDGGAVGRFQVEGKVKLHHALDVRDFEEDRLAVGRERGGGDGPGVASFLAVQFEIGRAVFGGPAVVPGGDVIIARVGGAVGVEWVGEGEHETIADEVKRIDHVDGLAGGADAVEAAGFGFIAGPAVETGGIELAVVGMPGAAHDARFEFEGESGDGALHLAVDFFFEEEENVSHAVGNGDDFVAEGTPGVGGNPELSAAGAVDEVVHPAEGFVIGGAVLGVPGPLIAVPAAGLDPIDAIAGHPVALVVDAGQFAAGTDAEAVIGAETAGDHLEGRSVFRDFHHGAVMRVFGGSAVAGAFDVIETAIGPSLQVEGELVEMFADHAVVIEVFVEIGFAVAVKVVEARDLIAAQCVDFVVDDAEAKRLKEPGGDALPGQFARDHRPHRKPTRHRRSRW